MGRIVSVGFVAPDSAFEADRSRAGVARSLGCSMATLAVKNGDRHGL